MQEQLRQFPAVAASFQKAQREGRLISTSLSAQWLAWLLLKATDTEFVTTKTIYNPDHYSRWLKPGQTISFPADFTKNEMSSISDLWIKPTSSKRIPNDPLSSTFKAKL